jgi:HdeA/HdeB family
MNAARDLVVAGAAFAAVAMSLQPAAAQGKGEIVIDGYSCRSLLRESGVDRDAAVAFLHGYILGRNGAQKFDVDTLRKQTAVFIERCLDNPQERALDAMLKSGAGKPDAPSP